MSLVLLTIDLMHQIDFVLAFQLLQSVTVLTQISLIRMNAMGLTLAVPLLTLNQNFTHLHCYPHGPDVCTVQEGMRTPLRVVRVVLAFRVRCGRQSAAISIDTVCFLVLSGCHWLVVLRYG